VGALRAAPIVPEALPNPLIPGFQFPESEATITGWTTEMSRGPTAAGAAGAAERIHLHGWGLWAALTMETAQMYEGQRLRVFETWLTPDDLTEYPGLRSVYALAQLPRRRTPLKTFDQFREIDDDFGPPARAAQPAGRLHSTRVVGFVKYDPSAADHIIRQQLLSTAALNTLLQGGAQQIPPFPATALVVKPLFQVIKVRDLIDGRYFGLKVWPGPPDLPEAAPPAQWPGVVWIDLFHGGAGRGAVDAQAAAEGTDRSDTTTYPLSSLIHYRLSAFDAAVLNADKPGTDASAGDLAILVAMHVAGREIARWTWQTFWWTPTPDDPRPPSSLAMARARPNQLRGAARNYAMAQAYTMLTPDPPHVGGENVGAAVYAYNPWIEARFAPADLPDSLPGRDPAGAPATNNYGFQTNCMSCHAQATYNPNRLFTAPRFAGARYVDLTDPKFYGTLQVDFLWSIARHAK
jgi:mono/diheme cytochrome c family protein